jgi:hypothetical protein
MVLSVKLFADDLKSQISVLQSEIKLLKIAD